MQPINRGIKTIQKFKKLFQNEMFKNKIDDQRGLTV